MTAITAAAPMTQTASAETTLRFMALRFYRGGAPVSARFLGERSAERRRLARPDGLGPDAASQSRRDSAP